MNKKTETYDVIIIGGGAAGLTAGIYCGRARLKTLLIEKSLVGGLATYTSEIANYPGFPEGSDGTRLMTLFHKQAKHFGVTFKLTDAKDVRLEGDTKVVETFRTDYHAKAVIIATGGRPRLTGAKGEDRFLYEKGISFCATCDAEANTGKTVLVVGSGDAAIEEGLFLTKFADRVIISVMHNTGRMDCNEIAKKQALENHKIEFLWNTVVDEFKGGDRLEHVAIKNIKTGQLADVKVDSCFLFIGYLPNTALFRGQLDMSPDGYLLVNERMETSVPGVFAAGDVCEKILRQVATAVGDGAVAGCLAEKYITENEMIKNQILWAGKPSVVYVWDAADQECRELMPVFERLEKENSDSLKVVYADIYKSRGIAQHLGAAKAPSALLANKGEIIGRIAGCDISYEKIMDCIPNGC